MVGNLFWALLAIVLISFLALFAVELKGEVIEAEEPSSWVVVQEDLVPMGRSRLRFIILQNKVTGKCYLTKDSNGSGFTPVDCPEVK